MQNVLEYPNAKWFDVPTEITVSNSMQQPMKPFGSVGVIANTVNSMYEMSAGYLPNIVD